jgi:hypothetical protein
MLRAIRDLLQNNPTPHKKDFMRKLGKHRDDDRRVNEWLEPYGMTYKEFRSFAKHPS